MSTVLSFQKNYPQPKSFETEADTFGAFVSEVEKSRKRHIGCSVAKIIYAFPDSCSEVDVITLVGKLLPSGWHCESYPKELIERHASAKKISKEGRSLFVVAYRKEPLALGGAA